MIEFPFFFYHNSHFTDTQNKNITITRYYFIFPVPGKKENSKLKQSEIEVKMIIKMKKHNLCSNWQIVFMSDTDKQTLLDFYVRPNQVNFLVYGQDSEKNRVGRSAK